MPRYRLKRLFVLLLFPLTFLLINLAKANPASVEEFYSRGFYPVISSAVNILTGFVQFSLAEVLMIVAILVFLFYILSTIIKISSIPREKRLYEVYKFFVNTFVVAAAVIFVFNIMVGFNYYRQNFFVSIGIREEGVAPIEATDAEVYALTVFLAKDAEAVRVNLPVDENNNFTLENTLDENLLISQQVITDFGQNYQSLRGIYAQPKGLGFSRIFSRFGVKGFLFPFTYEANINKDIPDHEILAVMVHETVHVRGYMGEGIANAIAYLACDNGRDASFKYSGIMMALNYTLIELMYRDFSKYEQVLGSLSDGIMADLALSSDYWGDRDGLLLDLTLGLNDSYLRSNNQKEGTESYGDIVQYLIEYYRVEEPEMFA